MDAATMAQAHALNCMAYAEEERRQAKQREARKAAAAADQDKVDLRAERARKGWIKRRRASKAPTAEA